MNAQYPKTPPIHHQKPPIVPKTMCNSHLLYPDNLCNHPIILPTIYGTISHCDPAWWRRNNSTLPLVDSVPGFSDEDGVVFSITSQILTPINPINLACLSRASPFVMRSASMSSVG